VLVACIRSSRRTFIIILVNILECADKVMLQLKCCWGTLQSSSEHDLSVLKMFAVLIVVVVGVAVVTACKCICNTVSHCGESAVCSNHSLSLVDDYR